MDTYSMYGDLYHQGYAQAPPPSATPVQLPPLGTAATSQASALVSTPLAPPGVAPSPSPAPPAYYGMYPPSSHGYLFCSADSWNAYSMPEAEPHPHSSYPPFTLPCHHRRYVYHPYHQEPFPYLCGYPGPPQAYMRLPSSDVTHFRRKRHLFPNQNILPKSKPLKKLRQSLRGVGKNFEQVEAFTTESRAFSVPFKGNSAHVLHPFWQNRAGKAPALYYGKKRHVEERGDGNVVRDEKRDGSAHSCWSKGKPKKGRNYKGELDSSCDVRETWPGEKGESRKPKGTPTTEVQAREAAAWLELHKDAHKRVLEFLQNLSENESSQKANQEENEEATQGVAGRGSNAEIPGTQELIQQKVGTDADVDVGNVDAALPTDLVLPQGDHRDAICANNIHAPHFNDTGEQQSAMMQADNVESLRPTAHTDAIQSDCPDSMQCDALSSNTVGRKQSSAVGDLEVARKEGPQVVPRLLIVELASVDKVKDEVNKQKPVIEQADSAYNDRKHHESLTEDKHKHREGESFKFFTKILEENLALRKLYVENCNDGAFECLMCRHSKSKKRFSNLVSLVSHASNVLKTKELPEHRGYGRAVCSLLGWDPHKIPKVPIKSSVPKSAMQMATPINEAAAVVGNGVVTDTVEHVLVNTAKSVIVADAVGSAPMALANQEKVGSDPDKIFLPADADTCAPANALVNQEESTAALEAGLLI